MRVHAVLVGMLAVIGLWASADSTAVAADAFERVAYVPGVISPSGLTQEALDVQLRDFYGRWKSVYLARGCGEGRVYVATSGDGKRTWGGSAGHSITVSEAHGYGMLITVMMADADPDAKALFDGMVRFFLDHPANSGPGLMAWNQVEDCSNAGESVGGSNSATDGDLDIAHALLLADRKWGSDGTFDYRALAERSLSAILEWEIASRGDFVLIGDWVNNPDDRTYADTTRSSDFLMSDFKTFADLSGDKRWMRVRDRCHSIISSITDRFSPETGLMPDFITGLPDQPVPASAGFLEGAFDGAYSWNAARYPWRLALDYLLHGETRARDALVPLNAWIRLKTGGDPHRVASTYTLDGSAPPDQGSNDMAFVSMLAVSAMTDPANQRWLDALWADMVDTKLADEDYFGNTLKLLAMIVVTGHWVGS